MLNYSCLSLRKYFTGLEVIICSRAICPEEMEEEEGLVCQRTNPVAIGSNPFCSYE